MRFCARVASGLGAPACESGWRQSRDANARYWSLIQAFGRKTGVPVLLNTSFNENEPIVLTPEQALDCFLRTDMDVLVMGSHVLEKVADGSGRVAGGGR